MIKKSIYNFHRYFFSILYFIIYNIFYIIFIHSFFTWVDHIIRHTSPLPENIDIPGLALPPLSVFYKNPFHKRIDFLCRVGRVLFGIYRVPFGVDRALLRVGRIFLIIFVTERNIFQPFVLTRLEDVLFLVFHSSFLRMNWGDINAKTSCLVNSSISRKQLNM